MVTYYICDEALALDRTPFFPTQFWFKKGNHEGFNCDSKPQFQLENCKPDVDHHQLLGVDFVS